jgi:hypothetical protein
MRSAADAFPSRCLPAARTGACCPWTWRSSSASSRRSWSTAARASAWSGSPTRHAAPRTHARAHTPAAAAPDACALAPRPPQSVPTQPAAAYEADAKLFPTSEFTFCGLVSLVDPPREAVAGAIATCHTAGIKVTMVTGDHAVTAGARAREAPKTGNDTCVLTQSARRGHRAQGWHHHAAHARGRGPRRGRAAGRSCHHGRAHRCHRAKRARGTCPLHA